MELDKRVWNIVVVDDENGMAWAVQRSLERKFKKRVAVEIFLHPCDALEKIGSTTDILITDFQMPAMNGPELIAKAREKTPGIKVVLMSGDDGARKRLAALTGDKAIVTVLKPFDTKELTDIITAMINA